MESGNGVPGVGVERPERPLRVDAEMLRTTPPRLFDQSYVLSKGVGKARMSSRTFTEKMALPWAWHSISVVTDVGRALAKASNLSKNANCRRFCPSQFVASSPLWPSRQGYYRIGPSLTDNGR